MASIIDELTRTQREGIQRHHQAWIMAAICGDPSVPGDPASDFLAIAEALAPLRKPEIWILHPADYASFAGVRHTRSGRWVWRGKTYRSRALALRRVPPTIRVPDARVDVLLDHDGVTKRGQMLVMERWQPKLNERLAKGVPGVY